MLNENGREGVEPQIANPIRIITCVLIIIIAAPKCGYCPVVFLLPGSIKAKDFAGGFKFLLILPSYLHVHT